jgi:hypothetical protein
MSAAERAGQAHDPTDAWELAEEAAEDATADDAAGHDGPGHGAPVAPVPLQPELAPSWLRPLLHGVRDVDAVRLSQHRIPAPPTARPASVLIAFGEDPVHGPDVLLVERASTLRDHAGQVAFPGGGAEPGDADEVATGPARGRGGDRPRTVRGGADGGAAPAAPAALGLPGDPGGRALGAAGRGARRSTRPRPRRSSGHRWPRSPIRRTGCASAIHPE